jgi:PleD family two-component response regulator
MKMKLSSINDNAEVAKQELEKTNTMLGEANNKLEETNVKLEEANDKLAILATTDELTQVKNRKAFDTELKEFISLV